MPMPLRLSRDVADVVLEHARGCLPEECCGLLLGEGMSVTHAWPARNELSSATRYRVDPRDFVAAVRYGRERGLDVIGAYHSHPTSQARPSLTDVAESVGEEFVYLIAGPIASGSPELRAFRFAGGNFLELPLVTQA
jgi:proteasome lid subunit RPN8/RPN11